MSPGAEAATVKGHPVAAVPKYTIRLVLIWLIPVVSLLRGRFLLVPILVAAALTPIEVPKWRQQLFGPKLRKQLPCLRMPALVRLFALWSVQVLWLFFFSSASPSRSVGAAAPAYHAPTVPLGSPLTAEVAWTPQSLSVVLPCAGEGEFAFKTARSVFETTPSEYLKEIIVVDDGSSPPLADTHLPEDVQQKYRVKVIRHASTVGLIGAKKDGGEAAQGDIIVFLDCHVAPQPGWQEPFLRLIGENYRRIVVPVITDLDITTWKQRGGNNGQAKCYLTWDADFKWFNSDDPYVPVLSGGLLGISRRWWNETGGYDEHMVGWGGENLDQSLRSWLCGGEILVARESFIAHMWRKPEDPRTRSQYRVPMGAADKNRMRAAVAWFGEFSEKLHQFPQFDKRSWGSEPWYGDISNILAVKTGLQCRSFAWFMHRFRHVYEDGGLVPFETFLLRSGSSGYCLAYSGYAGTSPNGRGQAVMRKCNPADDRQRWHGANRDLQKPDAPCCSGLRAWNTDQCLAGVSGGAVGTFVCDISGQQTYSQGWTLTADGDLRAAQGGFLGSSCIEADARNSLASKACRGQGGEPAWIKAEVTMPIEGKLYSQYLESLSQEAAQKAAEQLPAPSGAEAAQAGSD